MYILGISAFYHDSAACILKDGKIIAAAQEERFTRKKHDAGFPCNAIRYCVKEARISASEIDNVVFYEKPFTKFERLLETYLAFAPKGFTSFTNAIPVWMKDKLFQRKTLIKELKLTGLEKVYIERFSKPAQSFARTTSSSQIIRQLPRFFLEAIAFGGMMLMILYLMTQKGNYIDAIPIITLYAFAGYRLMPALQQIYAAIAQLTYVGPSIEKLYKDFIFEALKSSSKTKT